MTDQSRDINDYRGSWLSGVHHPRQMDIRALPIISTSIFKLVLFIAVKLIKTTRSRRDHNAEAVDYLWPNIVRVGGIPRKYRIQSRLSSAFELQALGTPNLANSPAS